MDPADGDSFYVLYVGAPDDRVPSRLAETGVAVEAVEPDGVLDRLESEAFDAVASAHRPPAVDGLAVLRTVRERSSVPFVLVPAPGAGGEGMAAEALRAGADDYVERDDATAAEDGLARLADRLRAGARGDGGDAVGGEGAADVDRRGWAGDDRPSTLSRLSVAAELALKEQAMDEAPVGITIADATRPDTPLVYANESFERLTGYSRSEIVGRNCRFLQGPDSDPEAVARMREATADREPASVELVNYREDGEPFWNAVTLAPLSDDEGTCTHFVGFQMDVTERKEAQLAAQERAAELGRERRGLERLLGRIDGLLGDVMELLVAAETRPALESGVCERVVEVDRYAFAWVGAVDRAREAVVPRARAGDGEARERPLDADGDPTALAARTRTPQVVDGATDGDADPRPAGSTAAVPLVYGETLHGVLTVRADRPDAFDDREVAVLEALGRAIGSGLSALERKRMLTAESVVELEFDLRDRALFFVAIASEADCRLTLEGAINRADAPLRLFFSVEGASAERVLAVARAHETVAAAERVTDHDGVGLFEFAVADRSVVALLAERGGVVRSIVASGETGTGRLVVELPRESDVRGVVELLEERYAGTDLVARRDRERPARTQREFVADVESGMTERQLTALQKAYLGDFFRSPRPTSGDELAASMGITRSTFHEHLRAAERKLVEAFFDR